MFFKQDLRLASLVGCLMMLFSCSSETEVDPNMYLYGNTLGNLDEVELRKEISLLIGQVLLDKESRDYALDYARFKNDNSESGLPLTHHLTFRQIDSIGSHKILTIPKSVKRMCCL